MTNIIIASLSFILTDAYDYPPADPIYYDKYPGNITGTHTVINNIQYYL